jgi:inner membrane protein involved in colicin E2 resistance
MGYMTLPVVRTNGTVFFKMISIGLVFLMSYAASLFVHTLVNDRVHYQTEALQAHAGDTTQVLIYGTLPGFTAETGVSVYRMVDRVLKYAILFITLTFLTFFLSEIFYKLRLHPIQYLLVGLGLAEFYLLLLALMEHIGFLLAYVISAVMTISLISLYSRFVLGTKRGALFIATLLTIIYSYLLVVLHLETYALLSGALLLFILLAGVMFMTRRLDWYDAFAYFQKAE